MITDVHPKLPMRNKQATLLYYTEQLGFTPFGSVNFDGYLMLEKDNIQIHFFEFKNLNPLENYGQVYFRTKNIEKVYQALIDKNVAIHPNGKLESKPWGVKEFSLLDPDNNLLTFGE